MDGAYRLVLLLLEPSRLRRLGRAGELADWVGGIAALGGGTVPAAVAEELALLADDSVAAPSALPETARYVACILQQHIAQEELPRLVDAVEHSERNGGNEAEAASFRRAVEREIAQNHRVRAQATSDLVQQMRIGQETVRSEFGFGLMNRVVTGLASVTVNLVTGAKAGVPVLPRLLGPVRAPLHAVASLIGTMSRDSKLGQALASAVLAIAGAIVALGITGRDVPPGSFVVASMLLAFVLVGAMARSGFVWLAVVSAAATAVITVAIVGEDLQEVVSDDPRPVEEQELAEGTTIEIDEGGRVRLETEGGERIEDLDVPDGAAFVLRDVEARALSEATEPRTQEWKRWGFTNHVSIARVLLAAIALAGAVVAVAEWRRSTWGTRASRAGWIGLAVAAAFAVRTVATEALTDDDQQDRVDDVKEWLVERATDLSGFSLELVLVVLVAAGIAFSVGADLAASRTARSARRRIVDVFRRGGRTLHAEVHEGVDG
jgi:hypothetical protein